VLSLRFNRKGFLRLFDDLVVFSFRLISVLEIYYKQIMLIKVSLYTPVWNCLIGLRSPRKRHVFNNLGQLDVYSS